jgi:hemin uptake protein HemP
MNIPRDADSFPGVGAQRAGVVPQRVQSRALLGATGELLIVHNAREYRLRLTQNGKLILTA